MKKILFFVLWFGFIFASCKNTQGGNESQIIKHKVSFGVQNSNTGSLTAQIKGGAKLTKSPSMVENGKTIVFTASPNKDYIVESWLKGSTDVTAQATDEGKRYELTVNEAVEVKGKFKQATPPSPQTHTLTFEVDGEGGTLKAEYFDDGVAIPTSPATVEHGKVVVLSASSSKGYEIEKWMHDGNIVNGERSGYDVTVNKDIVIKVSFKKISEPPVEMRKVTFGVVDNKGGSLKAKVEGEATEYTNGNTGFEVEKGKKVIFTAEPEANYEVEEWTSNGRPVPNKKDNEYKLSIGNNVNVLVKFKAKTAQTEDFVLINIPNEIIGIKPDPEHSLKGDRYAGIFIEGRRIKLSPYKMAKHELTYKLWKEVKDWAVGKGYKFVNEGQKGDNASIYNEALHLDDEPVTLISWRDAIIWCNAYTEKTLSEDSCVYRSHEDHNIILKDASDADHCNQVYFDKTKKGFRLPTEAEWELASRYQGDGTIEEHKINATEYGSGVWLTNLDSASGAKAKYNKDSPDEVKAISWFVDNSENKTHPVGTLKANSLGLYDVSGNAVELCFDWRDNKIVAGTELEVDPIGKNVATDFDKTFKVARSTPYIVTGNLNTVGNRSFQYKADAKFKFCGFRLARYAD